MVWPSACETIREVVRVCLCVSRGRVAVESLRLMVEKCPGSLYTFWDTQSRQALSIGGSFQASQAGAQSKCTDQLYVFM